MGRRTNVWLLLAAIVCAVATAGFVWTAGCRRNAASERRSRTLDVQEPQPVAKSETPSSVARLNTESVAGLMPEPPVAPPREVRPVPHAKQEGELPSKSAPPQPDRQAAVKAEIDALKKESIGIAETLIRDLPKESDPLGLIGMVYDRCNQKAKAWEYWEKALDRNPNRSDLYDTMATIALREGAYEKAAEVCRKGIKKFAQMPQLHYQLAEALNGLGRAEESVNELQIAIKLAPENGEFHRLLGKTYALLNEPEKAKISYETAIKLQPRSAAAHYGLAAACSALGMEDQSQRAMEQYEKLHAENVQPQRSRTDVAYDAWTYRRNLAMTCSDAATVYLANGMPGKAEPLLRRGAEADPEYAGCRIQLVQVLSRAKRFPEAIPILRQLIESEPRNAALHLRLASIYAQLDRPHEARAAAKKAMELAPDNKECRRFLEQLEAKR
ncbi:MAG: tetratricopeptide repeat protein [Thermoguttaceae bacterium]